MKTSTSAALIAAAILLATLPVSANAQSVAFVAVYPDEAASTFEFDDPSGVAYVVVTNAIPLKQISFRAPMPSCLGGLILYESSPYTITGDSQTGITIDFGECITAPATILTIYYYTTQNDPCCSWPAVPYTGGYPNTIEVIDCDDVVRPGASSVYGPLYTGECCITFDVLSPYEPYPSDGATGVPTNVELSWSLPDRTGEEWIYLTTQPYPPTGPRPGTTEYFTTYQPSELLQPNTTYYWAIGLRLSYDYAAYSGLWSFTTGDGPVATEQSTWGRVKALYAE